MKLINFKKIMASYLISHEQLSRYIDQLPQGDNHALTIREIHDIISIIRQENNGQHDALHNELLHHSQHRKLLTASSRYRDLANDGLTDYSYFESVMRERENETSGYFSHLRVQFIISLKNKKILNETTLKLTELISGTQEYKTSLWYGEQTDANGGLSKCAAQIAELKMLGILPATDTTALINMVMFNDIAVEILRLYAIGIPLTDDVLSAFVGVTGQRRDALQPREAMLMELKVRGAALEYAYRAGANSLSLVCTVATHITNLQTRSFILGTPALFCERVIQLGKTGQLNETTLQEVKCESPDETITCMLKLSHQAGLLDQFITLCAGDWRYLCLMMTPMQIISKYTTLTHDHLMRLRDDKWGNTCMSSCHGEVLKILDRTGLLATHGKELVDTIFTTHQNLEDKIDALDKLADDHELTHEAAISLLRDPDLAPTEKPTTPINTALQTFGFIAGTSTLTANSAQQYDDKPNESSQLTI